MKTVYATNKLLALLAAAALTLGTLTATAFAEESATTPALDVLVDECFDDYNAGYAGKTTQLGDHFIVDANQIGGGCVQVEEDANTGNLFLFSHVFTQVYSSTPLKDGYTFSLDIFSTQGAQNCSVFVRAPQVDTFPYYETDGYAGGQSSCVAGLVFNFQINSFSVNVKSFDPAATENYGVKENIFTFNLPEGVIFNDGIAYTNFKVVDDKKEVKLYVEDTLVGSIALSGQKSGYESEYFTHTFFETAVVRDAAGAEMGTVQNTLVESGNAVVGWATRVANMLVDNVYLAVPASEETETEKSTEPETTTPVEPETTVPAASESVTEPMTEDPTEAETTATTNGTTAAETEGTAASTDAETEPAASGCLSSIALGSVTALLAAAAFVISKRK